MGPRQQLLKGYALSGVRRKIQRQPDQASRVGRCPGGIRRVNHDSRDFCWLHLPQFDEDGASGRSSRSMAAARRIADIGTFAIVAVLIGKHAAEDEKFLAQRVFMAAVLRRL